ncbi:hypothetical protein RCL_jg3346.t1 [Rhizophagus clarus]|uniref:Uncharacterized protein n=1 Tax=Rhizophagus clarus TaxID=94130 RepID=A0A8H3M7Z2_9GLOM|nr:hypothetical protein RCL_jg3346.t1 [Rhizophagus clarus]
MLKEKKIESSFHYVLLRADVRNRASSVNGVEFFRLEIIIANEFSAFSSLVPFSGMPSSLKISILKDDVGTSIFPINKSSRRRLSKIRHVKGDMLDNCVIWFSRMGVYKKYLLTIT